MKKIIQELKKIFGIIKRNLTGSGENENNLTYSVNFGDLYNFWRNERNRYFVSNIKDLKLSELIGKNINYLDIKINFQSLYKKGMPISSVVKKGTVIGVKARKLGIISYSYELFIMIKDKKERPKIALINSASVVIEDDEDLTREEIKRENIIPNMTSDIKNYCEKLCLLDKDCCENCSLNKWKIQTVRKEEK